MKQQFCRKWTITLGMMILLFGAGCSDDDPGGGDGTIAHNLSITVRNGFNLMTDRRIILVVDNARGDSIIAVRSVTANGTVDFGDVGMERVTVTIKAIRTLDEEDYVAMTSYRNAPIGHWIFDGGVSQPNSLGRAMVTLNFPRTHPMVAWINLPGGAYAIGSLPDASQFQYTTHILSLDAGRMTILAIVRDSTGLQYDGWLADQPFQTGQDNPYILNLTENTNHRTITSSRPLDILDVSALRTPRNDPYPLYNKASSEDGLSFDVIVPDFPATKWQLLGMNWVDGPGTISDYYAASAIVDALPATLNVEAGEITGTYNSVSQRFENIAHTGSADYIWAEWTSAITWTVNAAADQGILARPLVPDSVYNPSTDSALEPYGIGAVDYNTVTDFNGFVAMEMNFGGEWPSAFTSHYSCAKTTFGAANTSRLGPPDPVLRKMNSHRQDN